MKSTSPGCLLDAVQVPWAVGGSEAPRRSIHGADRTPDVLESVAGPGQVHVRARGRRPEETMVKGVISAISSDQKQDESHTRALRLPLCGRGGRRACL
jgi:hypothetical protein